MFLKIGYIENSCIIFEEYEYINNDIIVDLYNFNFVMQAKLKEEIKNNQLMF